MMRLHLLIAFGLAGCGSETSIRECEHAYRDADLDGYGDALHFDLCAGDAGSAPNGTDCNDMLAGVNPGGVEACNRRCSLLMSAAPGSAQLWTLIGPA
jgi:hypothetical protein